MDPLQTRIQQIAAALRSQPLVRTDQSAHRGATPQGTSAGVTPQGGDGNEPMALAQIVANRVRMLGVSDPQRRRKVFQIFLESVLIAEFGDGIAHNPRFLAMVESVQSEIEADAELAPLVDTAVTTLLAHCDQRTQP